MITKPLQYNLSIHNTDAQKKNYYCNRLYYHDLFILFFIYMVHLVHKASCGACRALPGKKNMSTEDKRAHIIFEVKEWGKGKRFMSNGQGFAPQSLKI